jgi:photosystem II stability/assembly factor-like uncharacterized protein
MWLMRWTFVAFIFLTTLPGRAQDSVIQMEQSNTTASLRGIHSAGPGVAWASGTNGTVLRTEDAGFVWQGCAMPPGAKKLDFRGVWAWDAMTAIVMSSGPGDQSRLYKTTDGCVTWKLLLTNTDKDGFWDAIAFSDNNNGYLLGDPVDGRFVIRATSDGSESWKAYDAPEAVSGVGIFAASNSSMALLSFAPEDGWLKSPVFSTSGILDSPASGQPRFYFPVTGRSWTYKVIPLAGSKASAGVFSLVFRDRKHAVAVGGDYTKPEEPSSTAAWSKDNGQHWTASTKPPHGYRSAVAWDEADRAWITAGPNGTDYSRDDGKTWEPLENGNWNAISLPWLVGPGGRIGKLVSLPAGPHVGPAGQNAHSRKTGNQTGAQTR